MPIRGLQWGMTPEEATASFEGPQLKDTLGSGDLTAAPVPLGPFSASILLGFFREGLGNIRLILDNGSAGNSPVPRTLELLADGLSTKYGEAVVQILPGELNGLSTAEGVAHVHRCLDQRKNGSIIWSWRSYDAAISLQYLGVWGWDSSSENISILYERSRPKTTGQQTLAAQLGAGLL